MRAEMRDAARLSLRLSLEKNAKLPVCCSAFYSPTDTDGKQIPPMPVAFGRHVSLLRRTGTGGTAQQDYVSGRAFEDAVWYVFYPVNPHTQEGVHAKQLKDGIVSTMPLRALKPRENRGGNQSVWFLAG